jgi:hypothetical protein
MLGVKKITVAGAGFALGLATLSSIAPKAQAAIISYPGTTVGAPTWTRPNEGTPPTANTGTGTAVSYSSYAFNVDAPGTYNFLSVSTTPPFWDNYTFLYRNTFNPSTPLVNAIVGNNNVLVPGASGFSTSLAAGINYFFVTTGNTNASAGEFRNFIEGSGNILAGSVTAVPEPGTILGSALAFGYGIYYKRKIKLARLLDVDKETD